MSQSKVKHIFRVFDALNIVKGIKAIGGPDHQIYYIESGVYAPDRRITPLILQPYVEVSDPNGVIPAGDKIRELSSASWYIGEAILANKITDKESEATMDTPFAIGENNALHIRKNSTKSILLIFEGEYLDIRKDKNIHISLTYTLTTTSNTEVKPAPKLMLSKPQSWKYCPLENQTKAVIEATVSQDSKLYRSAVQWVKVEGNKETLIGENDPFYIEGQNTDKLTINPSLMGSTLIRAKNHDLSNKGIYPENLIINGYVIKTNQIRIRYFIATNGLYLDLINKKQNKEAYFTFEAKGEGEVSVYFYDMKSNKTSTSKRVELTEKWTKYNIMLPIDIMVEGFDFNVTFACKTADSFRNAGLYLEEEQDYKLSPYDYAPDGILKGTYQSDIKFTRYFPNIESEIDFLNGDTLRAGMDTVKMKAVFKTNKEEIKNPEQYFDIKWYLDPVEAGGLVEFLGEGEYLDVPISKIPLKARAIPFRLEYEFK